MKVSCFTKVKNPIPESQEMSWSEFIQKLSSHIEVENKLDAPAISPAEWPKGTRRSNEKVLRVHFAALDLDKLPDETVAAVVKILEPYAYLLHTTFSHTESTLNCLRVYLPLSRPVEVSEWPRFWLNLNALTGNVLDRACKDISRVYFVPSMPKGTGAEHYIKSHEGRVLDVNALVSNATQKLPENFVTVSNLIAFAKGLQRKTDIYQSVLGTQILNVARGESFAGPGTRDDSLFKICARLAERWPQADPKQIAGLFEDSLRKMNAQAEGAPTLDDVIEKFSRKQVSTPVVTANDLREDILDAFGGKRDTPYTEEELDQFAAEAGVSRSRFNKRWIIRKGESCYLFLGGQYGKPVSLRELASAAQIDLSPAHTSGVDCFQINEKGRRVPKKEEELIREYGTLAREIIVDLSAKKSTYDWTTQTLMEAPCPLRDLTPTFSEHVDQYLRRLGGKSQEELLDWVALVTQLEHPCAALFLYGASGAGKSILGLGLTRLWTRGAPTHLKNVLANFNDSLGGSPLVLADESIPKEGGSAEIRSLIQEYSRPLKRKFQNVATLMGSLRLMVMANNKKAMSWKESLNKHDVKAIADRILSIEVGEDSAEYLRSLGAARQLFVKGDAIAKHALWLRDNRKVDCNERFLVKGKDSTHPDSLVANSKMGPAVFDWLVCYLLNPSRMDSQDNLQIRVYKGQLLVMARGLVENWEAYVTNSDKRFATMNNISEALNSMSAPTRKQLYDNHRAKKNYLQVETKYLVGWAVDHGYSEEQILEALSKDTPSIYTEEAA